MQIKNRMNKMKSFKTLKIEQNKMIIITLNNKENRKQINNNTIQ